MTTIGLKSYIYSTRFTQTAANIMSLQRKKNKVSILEYLRVIKATNIGPKEATSPVTTEARTL